MDVRLPIIRRAEAHSPWELQITDEDTAVVVRRTVREHCRSSVHGGLVDDVLLVVSELITNTYPHTEQPRLLRLSSFRRGLLVEVGHVDPAPVLLASPSRPCPSRTCTLLDELCSGWGVLPEPDGGESAWALLPGSGVL